MKSLYILLFFVLFFSCSNSKYNKETELFRSFLKTDCNQKIDSSALRFVVISSYSCRGCDVNYLKSMEFDSIYKTIIICPLKFIKISSQTPIIDTVLIDTNNGSDNIEFCSAGITEIYFNNGKINKIRNIVNE